MNNSSITSPIRILRDLSALKSRALEFSVDLKTQLLVLQPTPFCNINCRYCYLPNRTDSSKISIATVESAIDRLIDDDLVSTDLTIVWHAGEPLVVSKAFYRQAFNVVESRLGDRCDVTHSFQTNATLIDAEWCELFKKYNVQIGVSIDGPRCFNDVHRKSRAGKGTYRLVMQGVKILCNHNIPFSAIAVITADSVHHPDAIFNFFKYFGATEIGLNFDEAEGIHSNSSLAGKEGIHKQFLQRIHEMNLREDPEKRLRIREFSNALRVISCDLGSIFIDGKPIPDAPQTVPFRIISVLCNGDFSTFSPELLGQENDYFNNFVIGNVHHNGYLESSGSESFLRLWEPIKNGISLCESSCRYFKYCGGGSPVNKLYENGTFESSETLYCQTMMQHPFDTVLEGLEKDISTQE